MTEPVGEPTYDAGQVDRRDTDAEPDLNARLGEGAGVGEGPDSHADPALDPANPRTAASDTQRQDDEGGHVQPG